MACCAVKCPDVNEQCIHSQSCPLLLQSSCHGTCHGTVLTNSVLAALLAVGLDDRLECLASGHSCRCELHRVRAHSLLGVAISAATYRARLRAGICFNLLCILQGVLNYAEQCPDNICCIFDEAVVHAVAATLQVGPFPPPLAAVLSHIHDDHRAAASSGQMR